MELAAASPEVEVITTPNVGAGGGGGSVVGVALVALGGYLLLRELQSGGLGGLPSLHLPEGAISGVTYSGTSPAAGAQVGAAVSVHNPTLFTKTYTLYGFIVPAGAASPAAAVGHLWPDHASGVTPNTAYRGAAVTVGPLGTASLTLYSAPWGVSGRYSVIWQLWLPGGTAPVATRLDAGVISALAPQSPAAAPGTAAPASQPGIVLRPI